MECNFKEKTIFLAVGELDDKNAEMKRHIEQCVACYDTYLLISKIRKIDIKIVPKRRIEENILDYSEKKIELKVNVFRNIIVSFSFSIATLLVFIIPIKNKAYTYDDFDNKISSIENHIVELNDYMNLDVFDF